MSNKKSRSISLVGDLVTVVGSSDPTKLGRKGEVVLETSKTLVLDAGKMGRQARMIRVEKKGTVLQIEGHGAVIDGCDIIGRLEDRLRSRREA